MVSCGKTLVKKTLIFELKIFSKIVIFIDLQNKKQKTKKVTIWISISKDIEIN